MGVLGSSTERSSMAIIDDFRIQLARDETEPQIEADWWEWGEGMKEQINTAMAAEGAGQPFAYVEWLRLAAMAYKRAEAFAEVHPEVIGEYG
jgi:hypothetical protein